MPMRSGDTGALILGLLIYLAFNISGTIYYTKLKKENPPQVSAELMNWNLASVILGWISLAPLNLSSTISYALYSNKPCTDVQVNPNTRQATK